jgi:hypothetical protein
VAEIDAGKLLLGQCVLNFLMVIQQDVERDRFGVVRDFQPDNLRRMACNQRAFLKIRIAADDDEAIILCVLPDFRIALALQARRLAMSRGKQFAEKGRCVSTNFRRAAVSSDSQGIQVVLTVCRKGEAGADIR